MVQRGETSVSRSLGRDEPDQAIELRRYLGALRRGRWLIIGLVAVITGTALALSLVLPKTYHATARILLDPTVNPLGSQDAASIERSLATTSALITTPATLAPVAKPLGLRIVDLQSKVSASVDRSANIIDVRASDGSASRAARIANDVARAFVTRQRQQDLRQMAAARARLRDDIRRLQGQAGSDLEIQALRTRLSELVVSEASAGSELQVAERADVPTAPASPRPVRNALLGFFASLFVGVLIALGRDQLVPRVDGPRELSRITDRPVLAGVPFVRRRGRAPRILDPVEYEAYQTLQATLRFQLPPGGHHVILITSALEDEGKTTATANLGRALARAGRKTLIVAADMRRPKLHELFDMPLAPGLAEVLTALDRASGDAVDRTLSAVRSILRTQPGVKGNLHVLSSGNAPPDPARLLMSDALGRLLAELRTMEYEYILLDGPPLLGLADGQVMAQTADEVILVSRLDRLTLENAADMRDVLDRLEVNSLGHVVIGVRRSVAYAYATSELDAS